MICEVTIQSDANGHCTAGSMYRARRDWRFADKRQPSPFLTSPVLRIQARIAASQRLPAPSPAWNPNRSSVAAMKNEETSSKGQGAKRAAAMGKVYSALLKDRRNLRRAARHAGAPNLKRRLGRLAFRRASDSRELADSVALDMTVPADRVESYRRDVGRANEISTVAACLRSNRKLRVAIERALQTDPPELVAEKLHRLLQSAGEEAGLLEARLRDIAVKGFPGSPPVVE